jgi:hypothetical protein
MDSRLGTEEEKKKNDNDVFSNILILFHFATVVEIKWHYWPFCSVCCQPVWILLWEEETVTPWGSAYTPLGSKWVLDDIYLKATFSWWT